MDPLSLLSSYIMKIVSIFIVQYISTLDSLILARTIKYGLSYHGSKNLLSVSVKNKENLLILSTFRKFDVNNDGKLSEQELLPALQSIGFNPTKDDIKRLIDAADDDNDGMIDYANQEFVALLQELEDEPYNQVLEAFEYLDKDGDGVISADELRALVSNHGDPMSEV